MILPHRIIRHSVIACLLLEQYACGSVLYSSRSSTQEVVGDAHAPLLRREPRKPTADVNEDARSVQINPRGIIPTVPDPASLTDTPSSERLPVPSIVRDANPASAIQTIQVPATPEMQMPGEGPTTLVATTTGGAPVVASTPVTTTSLVTTAALSVSVPAAQVAVPAQTPPAPVAVPAPAVGGTTPAAAQPPVASPAVTAQPPATPPQASASPIVSQPGVSVQNAAAAPPVLPAAPGATTGPAAPAAVQPPVVAITTAAPATVIPPTTAEQVKVKFEVDVPKRS